MIMQIDKRTKNVKNGKWEVNIENSENNFEQSCFSISCVSGKLVFYEVAQMKGLMVLAHRVKMRNITDNIPILLLLLFPHITKHITHFAFEVILSNFF